MSKSIGENEAIALLIYDGAPVYHAKKYDTRMDNQQKHEFICDYLKIDSHSELVSHHFHDGIEMYYFRTKRNRHFMEYVLTMLDYCDEYDKCNEVTSPVVFLTMDVEKAIRIRDAAIDTHNKITDALIKKFKSDI